MLRGIVSFLIIFSMFCPATFADKDDINLRKIYGQHLTEVPFFLRYSFYKRHHTDWGDTYYFERKSFLKDYESKTATEKRKQIEDAKKQAMKDRLAMIEKDQMLRKQRDRLREQYLKDRKEKLEESARMKEFESKIRDEQKKLQQLEQEFTQEAQASRHHN